MEGAVDTKTNKQEFGNLKRGSVAKLLESITRHARLQTATQLFFVYNQKCNIFTPISRGNRVRDYEQYTCCESACHVACDAISCRDHRLHKRDYRLAI